MTCFICTPGDIVRLYLIFETCNIDLFIFIDLVSILFIFFLMCINFIKHFWVVFFFFIYEAILHIFFFKHFYVLNMMVGCYEFYCCCLFVTHSKKKKKKKKFALTLFQKRDKHCDKCCYFFLLLCLPLTAGFILFCF